MRRFIIALSLLIPFLSACTPPKGYVRSPYLYSDSSRADNSRSAPFSSPDENPADVENDSAEQKATTTVKVKIYEGEPELLKAPGYRFKEKNRTIEGRGDYRPVKNGIYTPAGGKFILNKRKYAGSVQLLRRGRRFLYVNLVPVDEYLASVVAHEMSPSWPLEVLKAQAVVSRTYLLQKIKTAEAAGSPYHLDGTTSNQVYGGLGRVNAHVREAVKQTKGEIVVYKGRPAYVFFHSCSGGYTATASEVWNSKDLPYLTRMKTSFESSAPVYRWRAEFSTGQAAAKLKTNGINAVRVIKRSPSYRALKVQIKTRTGVKTMTGREFRRALGATVVKSTLFGARVRNGRLTVSGKGYGHGVGMSQWGARILIEKHGRSYREAIKYYFKDTEISGDMLLAHRQK